VSGGAAVHTSHPDVTETVLRLYRIPHSTNAERVALALAHKGLEAESVWVDPADRSEVRKVSGQTLVPVLVDGDEIVADSTRILGHLEQRFPQRPLFPEDTASRAEMELFVDWFDHVWKVPPNAIATELVKARPNERRIAGWGSQLAGWLDLFERLLEDRGHLLGEDFSAADCVAFPFLKYAALPLPDGDDELFHRVLRDYQPLGDGHPRLERWIRRVDVRPRA
jgi:glutathione S-transferase